MSKKSLRYKELKRIRLVGLHAEKRYFFLNKMKKAKSFRDKLSYHQKIDLLPKNSSPTRLRNRCWVTGRPRGVYRDFGLSRHVLREMIGHAVIPGIRQSSW
jgi:small subunit ribosomal protein S14